MLRKTWGNHKAKESLSALYHSCRASGVVDEKRVYFEFPTEIELNNGRLVYDRDFLDRKGKN